ncbi:MAG: hypothetical protein EKK57_05690 [Proteobacteria bacterium]|nr:MAG: hypothetical protein EKK57_05690 [Pseudomonadota bacterium]
MIKCPICNNYFKALASHLRVHKISSEEFLIKYPNCVLVSDDLKNRISNTCKINGSGKWMKGFKMSDEQKKAVSERVKGEKNPFYGKKHSSETKQRMSENHADFSGNKNPFKKWIENEENYNQWCEARKAALSNRDKNSEEYKSYCKEVSQRVSKLYLDGKLEPYGKNHISGHFDSIKFNDRFYYQSSYELKFLEFCESSIKINQLIKSPYRIEYEIDGRIYNYIPDFLVNNKILIEIKPESLLEFDKNPHKFKAGENFCIKNDIKFIIVTEAELENLEKVLTT